VWEQLGEHFRIVAPDLPGFAGVSAWRPRSFADCTRWLERMVDAMGVERGWIVGNSLGAAVVSALAAAVPSRCLGLVLVDGGPPPALPGIVRALAAREPFRTAITSVFRRSSYSASTPGRAFADPANVPAEFRPVFAQRRPPQLEIVRDMVLAGERIAVPAGLRTLLLWGARDRLMGSTVKAARRLKASIPGAELEIIDGAGHLPQVERPREFVAALLRFASARPGPEKEPSSG
jgi:pimeloyl-ACP methyl ester carboxylesterase